MIKKMRWSAPLSVIIKYYVSLLLFALSMLSSCTYDTDSVYNRETDQNQTAPDIGMVELHIGGDTVFVYGSSTTFSFSFISSNQGIIGVGFTVDGNDSVFVKSDDGHFRYVTGFLSSGPHILKVDLITHSGSSSIADLLDIEGYLFTKTWVLMVVDNYYTYFKEEVVNGYLRISFPKYRNSDLKEYEISRFVSNGYTVVGRVTIPEFTDSTYVGEGASYKVNVNTISGDVISWGEANFNSELPASHLYTTPENTYFVSWNKCKFFNAMDKYYTELSSAYSQEVISTFFSSPVDTILNLPDIHYGDVRLLRLRVIPKNGNLVYQTGSYFQFERLQGFTAGL
ncbi:MAG TPA: hypothetical protein VFC41_07285 [Anaerovoracaceae bacterium]|nr:hypothetical protein [Anaerovoracaceae bacterium]